MSKTLKTLTQNKDFAINETAPVGYSQLQMSCILRIADATESMAKNFADLQDKYLYQKDRADRYHSRVLELERSNSAYRGHITRLRNLCDTPDADSQKIIEDLSERLSQVNKDNSELLKIIHRLKATYEPAPAP